MLLTRVICTAECLSTDVCCAGASRTIRRWKSPRDWRNVFGPMPACCLCHSTRIPHSISVRKLDPEVLNNVPDVNRCMATSRRASAECIRSLPIPIANATVSDRAADSRTLCDGSDRVNDSSRCTNVAKASENDISFRRCRKRRR